MKGAVLVERGQDADQLQARVEPSLHPLHCHEQLLHTFEGEKLGLQRDEHLVGRDERVDHDQVE